MMAYNISFRFYKTENLSHIFHLSIFEYLVLTRVCSKRNVSRVNAKIFGRISHFFAKIHEKKFREST